MKFHKPLLFSFGLTFALMSSAFAGMVNINKADALTIQDNLNGIGKVKAERIVKYRKKHGAFKSIDELVKVKGIGKKLLDKNRKDISLTKGAIKTTSDKMEMVKTQAKPEQAKKPAEKPQK